MLKVIARLCSFLALLHNAAEPLKSYIVIPNVIPIVIPNVLKTMKYLDSKYVVKDSNIRFQIKIF